MAPRPDNLDLPQGADPQRVRSYLATLLRGHRATETALQVAEALAADTALHYSGRPCQVTVSFTEGRLRITVTAKLPPNPADIDPGQPRPQPMTVVQASGATYGAQTSQLTKRSSVWAELPWKHS